MKAVTANRATGSRRRRPARASEPGVLLTKLQPPAVRRRLVPRTALVAQVAAPRAHKLTLLAAPAGSGKTTLLAAWCQSARGERPFAWLSVDRWDNDPVRFWTHVVAAIRRAEPKVGRRALDLLHAPRPPVLETVLPALLNELESQEAGVVLILDDYHLIENGEIHEAVSFLVENLPTALRLVIATRSDPPLPLARLRVLDELLEIRVAELRFRREESAEFLNAVLGLDLGSEDVTRLHERTEGWAAGLYLAALSLRGRVDPGPFIAAFAGDDRHLVDYLGSEVLQSQPEEVRAFMLRTSILERLSGPLCDAVTGTSGSAEMLRAIEQANLFLVPLDTRRRWYRYHHLFGSLLLHELRRAEPELIPALHAQASAWYRAAGSIPEAIHHSIAAGETEQARELIAEHWNGFFNQGRLATVTGWLDALPDAAVAGDPRLGVARAWLALDLGRLEEVDAWIQAAESGIPLGRAGKGAAVIRAETSVLRAVYLFKIGDVGGAQHAARETIGHAPRTATFPRTAAHCILGITLYWSGQRVMGAETLEQAVRLARSAGNDLAASYALGYLSLIRVDEGDPEAARKLASSALELSDEPGFAEHFVMMMPQLGLGRALERLGEGVRAEQRIDRALELGRRGAGRIEIAAALVALADVKHARGAVKDARNLLAEAHATVADCPDPRSLGKTVQAAERRIAGRRPRSESVAQDLTDRELAVLRLLDTELSRREIAAGLYVSLNTVKTHIRSILRKLGASSRREAVERARALGLLGLL